jgi:hypothetical protein
MGGLNEHILPEEIKIEDAILTYDDENKEIDFEHMGYIESIKELWKRKVR